MQFRARCGKERGASTREHWFASATRRLITCAPSRSVQRRGQGGFTLAEVLAALVFMAIVIPVAVQALRVANLAGQVAQRKAEAARVAERILNESLVTTNWNKTGQSGLLSEGTHEFRWTLRNAPWQDPLRAVSVQVTFNAQGQNYDVRLSTLVDTSMTQ